MAQDIFLKIDGIDGESQDAQHKDTIQVNNWNWTIHQESTMHMGNGNGSGKATVEDLTIEHFVDRASPNLMKYCLTGKHIPEVKLIVRKSGGSPLEYLKITMNDVVITRVQPNGSKDDNVGSKETVSFSFNKVTQEYVVQNPQGGAGGSVTAAFDIKANKES